MTVSVSTDAFSGYAVPVLHTGDDGVPNWSKEALHHFLERMLAECSVLIHNTQYDLNICMMAGIQSIRKFPHYIDTQILAFLTDPNNKHNGLKDLSDVYLGRKMVKLETLFTGKEKESEVITYDRVCATDGMAYACIS